MAYIQGPELSDEDFPLFGEIRKEFGFLPNFYQAQTLRPDLIIAEADLVKAILVKDGALSRRQKEYIFLVCSARNLSTYCVAAHCEIVRMLKIDGPEPEQIAIDHTSARLPMAEKALLNFAVKLNTTPGSLSKDDIDTLRTFEFTDQQIQETVVTVGLAKFANYVGFGLGSVPDFDNPKLEFLSQAARSNS
jgi:uncharacterized peroxidase-related enzyme